MHYEINVSKNKVHFFATHARSLTTEAEARAVTAEIRARFPESEGFQVTVRRVETHSKPVEF